MSTWGVGRHDTGLPIVLSPAQIVADQNNYDPRFLEVGLILKPYILRLSADAPRSLTGIVALSDGREVIIVNIGVNAITLKYQDAGSAAPNRFVGQGGADVILATEDRATVVYDGTSLRWRASVG